MPATFASGGKGRLPMSCGRLLLVVLLLSVAHNTARADLREYAIKAAYLFHFTQFVEWPAEQFPPPGEPIRIGVLRPNPFETLLEEIVAEQTVHDRPIEVVYFDDADVGVRCHIVFIPQRSGVKGQRMLAELVGRPILLVGEDPEFVLAGGMVALVLEQNRVAIVINRFALEKATLSASSRLLRLARIVGDAPSS